MKFGAMIFMMLLIASCKESTTSTNTSPSFIVPLRIGNTWIRKATTYDTSGTILTTRYDTVRVSRDTTIDGEKWYFAKELCTNRTTGFWFREDSQSFLLAKYPAAVHDAYYTFNNDSITVLSKNANIYVSAGIFKCYLYVISNGSTGTLQAILYFAVDVGLIKQTNYDTTANGLLFVHDISELQTVVLH